jgi:outer membrane protein
MRKYTLLPLSCIVLLCFLFQGISVAEDKQNILFVDLRECIEKAIESDPDVNSAIDQIDIGHIRKKEAKWALILPRVDLETSYGPKLDFFGRPVVAEDIYRSKASIVKPIYKGGELITSYRLGKREITRAQHDYLQKAMGVMEDTIKNYYKLLSAQENVKYYKELYKQAEQTVTLLHKKFRIGTIIWIDVLEAETKLNEIKYELIKSQGDFQVAMATLNETIGVDPGMKTRVIKEFPIRQIKGDFDTLISLALKNRPDLLYETENLKFERLRMKLNRSKELPNINLTGSYSWEGDDFPGQESEWAVMLNLTYSLHNSTLSSNISQNKLYKTEYNFAKEDEEFDVEGIKFSIFDGSSNKVNLRRAKADYRLSSNRLAKLKRTIIKEVREALNKFLEAQATIDTTRKSIEYTEEKLKILEERLRLRETTEIDVLEARVQLVDAKIRNLQTLYERSMAIAGLYKAIGKRLEWKENKK